MDHKTPLLRPACLTSTVMIILRRFMFSSLSSVPREESHLINLQSMSKLGDKMKHDTRWSIISERLART